MVENLTFITWNVRGTSAADDSKKVDFLNAMLSDGPTIVALQEVTRKFYERLVEARIADWVAHGLHYRPYSEFERKSRHLSCALLGRGGCFPSRIEVIERSPTPEKCLAVKMRGPMGEMWAASFHAPTGAGHKMTKADNFISILEWLQGKDRRIVFGIDANSPKVDHPDPLKTVWFRAGQPGEEWLFGAEPRHQLRDVWRTKLADEAELFSQIVAERPEGPIEVTHYRGARSRIPCRYDRIYASSDWEVLKVEHLLSDSLEAGSDHAAVRAILRPN